MGPDGSPRITRPPSVAVAAESFSSPALALGAMPDPIRAEIETTGVAVVGGEALPDGSWRVVVMARDSDGVTRPRTMVVTP